MNDFINKEIYKEMSRIMTQDMSCNCEVVNIGFTREYEPDYYAVNSLNYIENTISVAYLEYIYNGRKEIIKGNYAKKMYYEYRELYEKYKNGDSMKVLFIAKKNKERFDAWYNYMDVVKKHRKVIIVCNSPLDFCYKFDANKMGAAYTTFYFDKDLGPADVCERVNELSHHYNTDAFKYIIENKLRTISIDDMLETNDMSKFEELHIHNDIVVGSDKKSTNKESEATKEMHDNLEARVAELENANKEYERKIKKLEERVGEDSDYIVKWMDDVDKRFNAIKKAINDI